jgi:hypothetical protein
MAKFALWHQENNVEDWPPDKVLYVPMADVEYLDDEFLPCDIAYTSEEEAREHFWFKQTHIFNPEVHKMTVSEYIEMMRYETDANPFTAVNKGKFIFMWKRHYEQ